LRIGFERIVGAVGGMESEGDETLEARGESGEISTLFGGAVSSGSELVESLTTCVQSALDF